MVNICPIYLNIGKFDWVRVMFSKNQQSFSETGEQEIISPQTNFFTEISEELRTQISQELFNLLSFQDDSQPQNYEQIYDMVSLYQERYDKRNNVGIIHSEITSSYTQTGYQLVGSFTYSEALQFESQTQIPIINNPKVKIINDANQNDDEKYYKFVLGQGQSGEGKVRVVRQINPLNGDLHNFFAVKKINQRNIFSAYREFHLYNQYIRSVITENPDVKVIPALDFVLTKNSRGQYTGYLVMPIFANGDGENFAKQQNLSSLENLQRFLPCACSLATTVYKLNEREIFHRDLKLDNLLFGANNEPFLADFGSAAVGDINPYFIVNNKSNVRYLEPDLSHTSDKSRELWRLGLTLIQMLDLDAYNTINNKIIKNKKKFPNDYRYRSEHQDDFITEYRSIFNNLKEDLLKKGYPETLLNILFSILEPEISLRTSFAEFIGNLRNYYAKHVAINSNQSVSTEDFNKIASDSPEDNEVLEHNSESKFTVQPATQETREFSKQKKERIRSTDYQAMMTIEQAEILNDAQHDHVNEHEDQHEHIDDEHLQKNSTNYQALRTIDHDQVFNDPLHEELNESEDDQHPDIIFQKDDYQSTKPSNIGNFKEEKKQHFLKEMIETSKQYLAVEKPYVEIASFSKYAKLKIFWFSLTGNIKSMNNILNNLKDYKEKLTDIEHKHSKVFQEIISTDTIDTSEMSMHLQEYKANLKLEQVRLNDLKYKLEKVSAYFIKSFRTTSIFININQQYKDIERLISEANKKYKNVEKMRVLKEREAAISQLQKDISKINFSFQKLQKTLANPELKSFENIIMPDFYLLQESFYKIKNNTQNLFDEIFSQNIELNTIAIKDVDRKELKQKTKKIKESKVVPFDKKIENIPTLEIKPVLTVSENDNFLQKARLINKDKKHEIFQDKTGLKYAKSKDKNGVTLTYQDSEIDQKDKVFNTSQNDKVMTTIENMCIQHLKKYALKGIQYQVSGSEKLVEQAAKILTVLGFNVVLTGGRSYIPTHQQEIEINIKREQYIKQGVIVEPKTEVSVKEKITSFMNAIRAR